MHTHPAPTERLVFRLWTPDDLPLAQALWGDPQVTRLFDGRPRLPAPVIRAKLQTELRNQAEHGYQYWPCFLKDTGEHVGCTGLRPFNLADHIPEFGVHLRPAFWGQGLASEAARAVVAHAFHGLRVPALSAGHHPNNHASRRLLLGLGFLYTQHDLYEPTGLMHPSYLLHNPAPLTGAAPPPR